MPCLTMLSLSPADASRGSDARWSVVGRWVDMAGKEIVVRANSVAASETHSLVRGLLTHGWGPLDLYLYVETHCSCGSTIDIESGAGSGVSHST